MSDWELKLTKEKGVHLRKGGEYISLTVEEGRRLVSKHQNSEAEAEAYAQKLWDATPTHHKVEEE